MLADDAAAPGAPVARASTLNPEAGAHPVAGDPRELRAAARAVRRSWQQFPYYRWRYGARGRRFSASDSGWLVTLCDEGPLVARRQVEWLGGVLAARGMPRWMLECHLALLHEELVRARPARAARYARLAECASALRAERRARLDDAAFDALAEPFDAAMPEPWRGRLRRVGGLLVAAAVDERCGIAGAVPSLEAWVCDPARFPAAWVARARGTVDAARARLRGAAGGGGPDEPNEGRRAGGGSGP